MLVAIFNITFNIQMTKLWIWCWWYQEHPPKCPPSELYHINLRVARGQTEPIKLCSSGHTPHPSGAGQFLTDRKSLGAGKHQFSNPANPPTQNCDGHPARNALSWLDAKAFGKGKRGSVEWVHGHNSKSQMGANERSSVPIGISSKVSHSYVNSLDIKGGPGAT